MRRLRTDVPRRAFARRFTGTNVARLWFAVMPFLLPACRGRPEAEIAGQPRAGFVYLQELAPAIREEMRYAGNANFIGRPIAGYVAPRCVLSREAAAALVAVLKELQPRGLSLKVFDCYRPQRAVDDFATWSRDLGDQKMKADHYPNVPKSELFRRGYIDRKSGHSRGSTVDLTLVWADHRDGASGIVAGGIEGEPLANREVDMGSAFDLFDERSHTDYAGLPPSTRRNRQWFKQLMERNGFRNLPTEWWHYTLEREPWPDQYFDFPVE